MAVGSCALVLFLDQPVGLDLDGVPFGLIAKFVIGDNLEYDRVPDRRKWTVYIAGPGY